MGRGYDPNYAGVIIGPDLRYDPVAGRLFIDRDSYFDGKGKANNKMLGLQYDDNDLLLYIRNIYAVLLTRGIRGTYVYVCDPALRQHLAPLISTTQDGGGPPDLVHSRTLGEPPSGELQIEFGTPASETTRRP